MRRKLVINLLKILFLCSIYCQASAVIYKLNDTEYNKLPPIFHVEPYEECRGHDGAGGMYCAVELTLVSDGPNSFLDLITEYSAFTVAHYNHSLLRYNLCVTETCKDYFDNTTTDLVDPLEACLNKTFQEKYGLKTSVMENDVHCKKVDDNVQIDAADVTMCVVFIGILIMNSVGSFYDFCCTNGKSGEGNSALLSFSIRRNWKKLLSPAFEGPDSKMERLKCISAVKCISTMLVIGAHSFVSSIFFIDNTKFMEDLYSKPLTQFLISGTVGVQTFFLISGFLLSYNLELMSEKPSFKVNWMLIPKGLFLRWIRLTPMYAFVLFYVATIHKFVVTGPHAYVAETAERIDCKEYWWQHLLYMNNYNDLSLCMPHTWYLASDTQLCVMGIIIYITCRSTTSRKIVFPILMVVATAIPVAHTYWQDLDGIMIASPEVVFNFFLKDCTFRHLYRRGHTNIPSYLMGMIFGYLAYYGQRIKFQPRKYRRYLFLYYLMVPLGVVMVLPGKVFLQEGPRPSLELRMLFAAYQKPAWCLLVGCGILGVIFKYEKLFAFATELRFWTPLSRMSYCAYLANLIVVKTFVAAHDLTHVSTLSLLEHILFNVVTAYVIAFPCWILVEQPVGRLLSSLLRPESRHQPEHKGPKVIEEGANESIAEIVPKCNC